MPGGRARYACWTSFAPCSGATGNHALRSAPASLRAGDGLRVPLEHALDALLDLEGPHLPPRVEAVAERAVNQPTDAGGPVQPIDPALEPVADGIGAVGGALLLLRIFDGTGTG